MTNRPSPTCSHPHLKFQNSGRFLTCVDCDRRWDAGAAYMNPKITEFDTRHDKFSTPRNKKRSVG